MTSDAGGAGDWWEEAATYAVVHGGVAVMAACSVALRRREDRGAFRRRYQAVLYMRLEFLSKTIRLCLHIFVRHPLFACTHELELFFMQLLFTLTLIGASI